MWKEVRGNENMDVIANDEIMRRERRGRAHSHEGPHSGLFAPIISACF